MRIFGLDIIRCSKRDQEELDTYKLVTNELYDRLVEFLGFIGGLLDVTNVEEEQTEAIIQQLFERVETVSKLIILYQQNKFSIPITAVSVLQYMNQFREHASRLQNLMLHYAIAEANIDNFDSGQEEIDYEDTGDGIFNEHESPYAQQMYRDFENVQKKYMKSRKHLLKILFADVNKMVSIVQYDQFLILFGVDIIRAHRVDMTHAKRKKPDYEVKIFNHFKSNKSNNGGNAK